MKGSFKRMFAEPTSEHADIILNIFRVRGHVKKLAYKNKMEVYLRGLEVTFCQTVK